MSDTWYQFRLQNSAFNHSLRSIGSSIKKIVCSYKIVKFIFARYNHFFFSLNVQELCLSWLTLKLCLATIWICVSKRKCSLLKTHEPFPTDVPELLYLNWNLKKKSFVIYERATKRDKKKKITTSIFCTVLIVRLGNLIRIVHWSASRTSNFTSIGIFLRQVKFCLANFNKKRCVPSSISESL